MDEKKIKALSDEELDKVAGGEGSGIHIPVTEITCPNCNEYMIHRPPMDGSWIVRCHNCKARITFLNGEVQSIEPEPEKYSFSEYETPL
ncbi:MAG: hypothetical protein IKO07_01075 [Clostridia bacterium]|nr:hypothetical protein [Clostridia bacterium]